MLGNLKPIYRPGSGAHLPRADVGPAGPRDRLGRHRQEHPRRSWPPRSSTRSASGGPITALRKQDVPLVAPSHATGKPLPAPIARGVPARGRRHDAPDHPVLEHAAVPHQRGAVVEHRVDRRRTVPVRRDPAPRRRTRRRAGHAARNPARRDAGSAGGCGPTSRPGWCRCAGVPDTCWGPRGSGRSGAMRPPRSATPDWSNIAVWADPERGLVGGR